MIDLSVFGSKQIEEFFQIIDELEDKGITVEAFRKWWQRGQDRLVKARKQLQQTKKWKMLARNCPDCGGLMVLYPVNSNKKDRVDGDYKSMWLCRVLGCEHSLMNKNTVREEVEMLKGEVGANGKSL